MINRLPVQHVRNKADTQDEYIVAYHDGTWLGTVIVTDEAIGSYDDYGDIKVAVERRIQSMVLSENCRGTWYLPKKPNVNALTPAYTKSDLDTDEKLWRFFSENVPAPSAMPQFLGDNHALWEERNVVRFIGQCVRAACKTDGKVADSEATKHICVWAFKDAPKEYQDMSPHGGDEDWVALIPASRAADFIGWIDDTNHFGCSSVSSHPLPDGREVRIGAHA